MNQKLRTRKRFGDVLCMSPVDVRDQRCEEEQYGGPPGATHAAEIERLHPLRERFCFQNYIRHSWDTSILQALIFSK